MRGTYTAFYQATGVGSARTLLYITAPRSGVCEILSAKVTDTNVTGAEQLDIGLGRITTLGTPTATTLTPRSTEVAFGQTVTSQATVKANVTASEPTYETDANSLALFADRQGVPNVGGYYYDPLPEERVTIPPDATFGLKLFNNPPANSYTLDITLTYREIG